MICHFLPFAVIAKKHTFYTLFSHRKNTQFSQINQTNHEKYYIREIITIPSITQQTLIKNKSTV